MATVAFRRAKRTTGVLASETFHRRQTYNDTRSRFRSGKIDGRSSSWIGKPHLEVGNIEERLGAKKGHLMTTNSTPEIGKNARDLEGNESVQRSPTRSEERRVGKECRSRW